MAMSSTISVLCAFFALSAAVALAAHSAPAPGADCTNLVLNMAECLSYVTVGGTAKKPEGGCCSGLKTVLKTDPECLCEAFKNSAQFGVTLNVTKAMALPAACHLSAPSVGNCAASMAPGAAPALSPMMPLSPSSSIAGAPGAGSGATEGAPVPTPGSSGSCALTTSIEFLVVTTMVAAAALSFALF